MNLELESRAAAAVEAAQLVDDREAVRLAWLQVFPNDVWSFPARWAIAAAGCIPPASYVDADDLVQLVTEADGADLTLALDATLTAGDQGATPAGAYGGALADLLAAALALVVAAEAATEDAFGGAS